MSGLFLLDWGLLAVSLFNTIVLAWLGLTVLLNADRRLWGVWLMGGGLLGGAAFFVSHTAMLGQELALNADGLNVWWRAGWLAITISPYIWYLVVLWYGGFWTRPRPPLYRRHLPGLVVTSGGLLWLTLSLLLANPVPPFAQALLFQGDGRLMIAAVPFGLLLRLLLFPALMVACILLSLDVLRRPAQPEQPITSQARQRAHPWLLATAGVLLAVSLLVAGWIAYLAASAAAGAWPIIHLQTVAWFDLLLAASIAGASLLVGQAVVAHEVFTGKVLPRRSFLRHWRNVVILAAGYAVVIGWSLTVRLRPIYALLLTALLMVAFYALYNRRSFLAHEQFMARLRPFVNSQAMAAPPPASDGASRAQALFALICRDLLGTDQAQLLPLGSLAPLAPVLVYPPGAPRRPLHPPPGLGSEVMALDPARFAGYHWAIPLWAERGRIGVFFAGAKQDGGLYSQEEMEIAQTGGERIIETLAGEQMARRLMELQRRRVTEQRVLDLHTRRVLHDQVLPALHSAVLSLNQLGHRPAADTGASDTSIGDVMQTLAGVHRQIADLLAERKRLPAPGCECHDLGEALRALVDDEFGGVFASVTWQALEPCRPDPLAAEILLGAVREALRNAALHGRGDRPDYLLRLTLALTTREQLQIVVRDNGVGLSPEAGLRAEGGGNGLALHSTLLAVIGGYLAVESPPDGGVQVTITAPLRTEPL
ncbi:MAG TPA: ATP-binding protein [Caldilineaceae bacterium]|nr:ATP-binding protein [Caldilineaceae bacterium]